MQTNDFSNLPTSWQIKTLGEVCEIISKGATPKIQNKTADNNSALFLKAENVTQNGCVNFDSVKFIDYNTHTMTLKRSMLKNLDILITIAGSLARCAVLEINPNQQVNINQAVSFARLKDINEVNPYFVKYFIMNPTMQLYLLSKAKTTAVPNLTLEIIRDIQIPLPPLEIQKRIVARLESAFEKIEKGSAHLQNAKTKLAKYKQSLLKSVFDGTLFCHTEGEARSISNQESRDISLTLNMTNSPSLRANEASVAIQNNDTTKAIDCHSPNGLCNDSTHSSLRESAADEAIHKVDCHESANADSRNDNESVDCHDLTSSKLAMTDKENPKLPQGWTIKTLGEIGEIISGGTPSTKQADNFGGDIAWITPADLSNHNNKFISQGKRNISEKGLKNSSARLVPKGTILFSSRAPIGYVAIASNQLCTNQGFKNLIPNKNVSSEFVYYYLLNSKNLAESYASGTTFKEISAKSFSKLPIPLPPLETQKQIVKLLEKHLQHADKTGKFIESALNKAKQLKQSLLKSAFLGKLT